PAPCLNNPLAVTMIGRRFQFRNRWLIVFTAVAFQPGFKRVRSDFMVKQTSRVALALLGLAVSLTVTFSAFADDKEKKADDGWVSLFNGKDLTGWKISENGKFTVEDGCIVVRGNRAHLFTDKEFKNFNFKCEVMTAPGSNSGLFVHTKYE